MGTVTVFICEDGHPYHLVHPNVMRSGEVTIELEVVERRGCRCGKRCAARVDFSTDTTDLALLAKEAGIQLLKGNFEGRPVIDLTTVPKSSQLYLV